MELIDIVKSGQKFETQTIGCDLFVSSNIAHRDKVKYCLINTIPSTRECLLFFKFSVPTCFVKHIYLFKNVNCWYYFCILFVTALISYLFLFSKVSSSLRISFLLLRGFDILNLESPVMMSQSQDLSVDSRVSA